MLPVSLLLLLLPPHVCPGRLQLLPVLYRVRGGGGSRLAAAMHDASCCAMRPMHPMRAGRPHEGEDKLLGQAVEVEEGAAGGAMEQALLTAESFFVAAGGLGAPRLCELCGNGVGRVWGGDNKAYTLGPQGRDIGSLTR